jgi:penicillin-binding protein 1C
LAAVWAAAAFEAIDRRHPPPLDAPGGLSQVVVDRDGQILRAFANGQGRWRLPADLDALDPRFVPMLLAIEDKRFFAHPGVDPLALLRGAWQLATSGQVVSGGSTITMQLARLIEDQPADPLAAKALQVVRALQIERRLGKREILARYLTHAPYGGNIEGVRAAALAWFGQEPGRLRPEQAAMLIALPQSPEARRPDRHAATARAARDQVLRRLVRAGAIEAEVGLAAMERPAPTGRRDMPAHAAHLARALGAAAPGDRVVATSIDGPLQRRLEALALDRAASLGPKISVAVLAAEHQTGRIVAHVASADFRAVARAGAVDMVQAKRSPGSTLKPLIYGLAFEAGLAHPETLIDDRPVHFAAYAPENFDHGFRGTVSLRAALAQSLNVPAVKLLEAVGPHRLLSRLRRLGVEPALPSEHTPGLAVGLGGLGLSLHDLVSLYGAIARGGEPIFLTSRPDGGHAIRRGDALGRVAAAYVTDILRQTPPPAAAAGGAIAFKTGTSYGFRDAWAVGYDGARVIGVWVGRADGAPVASLTGRGVAAPILFDAFARVEAPRATFAPPPSGFIAAGNADLPAPLRRFRAAAAAEAGPPLVLAFPPDGARLDAAPTREPGLPLKAEGGRLPLTWFANGEPIGVSHRRREVRWLPDGPGFAALTVVDAAGNSARAQIFLGP